MRTMIATMILVGLASGTAVAQAPDSEEAAVARIEPDYPNAFVTDYMSLLKIDGEWRIVNKIFHVQEPSASSTRPEASSNADDLASPFAALNDRMERAIADNDPERVVALFAENAVELPPNRRRRVGREDIAARYADYLGRVPDAEVNLATDDVVAAESGERIAVRMFSSDEPLATPREHEPSSRAEVALERGTAAQAACGSEAVVQPGRWLVESVREGEEPATGRADVLQLDGGCILIERMVLHFDDGSSHHIVFVQGTDSTAEKGTLVQIGDHPLFLVWQRESSGRYRTVRRTDDGPIELRWVVRPRGDGFERELLLRRDGQSEWNSSEVITYEPLEPVEDVAELPSLVPGPFHEPEACEAPEFREMDYMLGHWFTEQWVREDDRWAPGTVSEGSVRPVIGGCALLEKHPTYADGVLDNRRLLVRGYDAAADRWRQLVFGFRGGVWEWDIAPVDDGWLLTPVGGEMAGRFRIFERPDSVGLSKTIETRDEDGAWVPAFLIRYVPR